MRPGAESSWYDKPTTLPDGQSFITPAYCDSPDHPRNASALYRDHTHSRQFTILLQQIFLLSLCTYMRSKHEANSRAFSVSATSTWKSLPAHIRSIDTVSTLKTLPKIPPFPACLYHLVILCQRLRFVYVCMYVVSSGGLVHGNRYTEDSCW